MEDLYGNPAILFRVTSDRQTYSKMKDFIDQFANGILFILFALGGIAILFDRMVLRRLEILNNSLIDICDKQNFNQPIFQDSQNSKTKEDEINQLSQSINILLKKIYFAQKELENNNIYLEEYVAKRTHELLVLRSRAEESNLIKAQFLANISHEIRTPINGIVGMSYLLRDTHLNEEQKEFLETIEQSSGDLLKMVNNILDFSSFDLDQKTHQESYIPFNLKELIEIAISEFHHQIAEKNVMISYEILRTIPNEIISNNNHLRVILKNLISNAVKFTDQGYIYIRIEFYKNTEYIHQESQENSLSWLSISVKDSGIGISEHQHKTIFEPFNRTNHSLTEKYGGIGLGLAIVKKLVEYEGGQIWVESEEGNGCQFNFTYPCLFK